MKVLIKSAWGSDESTKAAFAFLHANAFSEAGHEVQIFLLGEAVNLMRNETMNSVTPVGWPPLSKIMQETIGHKIPLNIWTACSRARAVRDTDLDGKNARFVTPPDLVALAEWADKILSE
jgi:predicted peroxiredoxin